MHLAAGLVGKDLIKVVLNAVNRDRGDICRVCLGCCHRRRVAENTAGQPWNRIRAELQRQHAVTWTGPAGTFRQTTDLTKPLRDLYTALSIEPPKKILALDPAPATP